MKHAYLPGSTKFDASHWSDAPLSFFVLKKNVTRPFKPETDLKKPHTPDKFYLCGNNCNQNNCAQDNVFGKYYLTHGTKESDGIPYYKFDGELTDPSSKVSMWLATTGTFEEKPTWVINQKVGDT